MALPDPVRSIDATLRPLRILLVEDDALQCMVLAELLASLGHDVCGVVATEVDAIAAALRELPDLMLVDAHLQSGSGVSAMNSVLRQRTMPHIYMSGSSRLAIPANATLLRKPFSMADLRGALEHVGRQMAGSE